MSDGPHQLDYSPPPPLHHRRSIQRWLLFAIVLLLVGLSYFWWDEAVLRCRLNYWQQKCMVYTAPPTLVVHESFSPQSFRVPPLPPISSTIVPPIVVPEIPRRSSIASEVIGQYTSLLCPAWATFYSLLSPPGRLPAATLFLHERCAPSGKRWLVAVHTGAGDSLDVDLVEPAILPGRPRLVVSHSTKDHFPPRDMCRYYAGQSDMTDPTHFTIGYDTQDGQKHILDGWVKDPEIVVIEERGAAASTPTP